LDGNVLTAYINKQGPDGPDWGWPTSSVTKQTAFGISGSSVAIQGGRSIISSSIGTVVNDGADKGAIFAGWSPTRRGWPTSPMQSQRARGIDGYWQDFQEGSTASPSTA